MVSLAAVKSSHTSWIGFWLNFGEEAFIRKEEEGGGGGEGEGRGGEGEERKEVTIYYALLDYAIALILCFPRLCISPGFKDLEDTELLHGVLCATCYYTIIMYKPLWDYRGGKLILPRGVRDDFTEEVTFALELEK